MSLDILGADGLDYAQCHYGASKLAFRGPARDLNSPYAVALGGIDTFGKFVEVPFCDLFEQATGLPMVNMGHANAGVDLFMQDGHVLDICRQAEATVIQVLGPQNMTNRLYSVHPRRNDRFVRPTKFLETLYRDLDFSQFHYTRHLLTALRATSQERYKLVVDELQAAWVGRMQALIKAIRGDIYLLWLSDRPIDDLGQDDPLGHDPLMVTRSMLEAVKSSVADIVEVVATRDEIEAGRSRMIYGQLEEPVAFEMLGPVVHETVARSLQDAIVPDLGL